MAILPATGSAMVMGSVYTRYTAGAPAPTAAMNLTLRGVLGGKLSISTGALPLSGTFGGRTTPY